MKQGNTMICIAQRNAKTKDNRTLDMFCYAPPLESGIYELFYNIAPFGEPWKSGMEERVNGSLVERCRDRFILGFIDNVLVGKMWYTVNGDFATFGSVFTAEQHRGCGISSLLLDFTTELLDGENGLLASYLAVGKPIPRAMYAKSGWQPYNDTLHGCIMRRFRKNEDIDGFDANYYSGLAPYDVHLAGRSDLPRLEALYNLMLPDSWSGRNFIHGLIKNVAVECQIDAMLNEVKYQQASLMILEDSRKHLLGALFRRNHEFDFFTAPGALAGASLLFEQALVDTPEITTVQFKRDKTKIDFLQTMGFSIVNQANPPDHDQVMLIKNEFPRI